MEETILCKNKKQNNDEGGDGYAVAVDVRLLTTRFEEFGNKKKQQNSRKIIQNKMYSLNIRLINADTCLKYKTIKLLTRKFDAVNFYLFFYTFLFVFLVAFFLVIFTIILYVHLTARLTICFVYSDDLSSHICRCKMFVHL